MTTDQNLLNATHAEILSAVRLCLAAAADEHSAVAVITALVGTGEPPEKGDTVSVDLFLEAIKTVGGELKVQG